MIVIGDYITFDGGLIGGAVVEVEDGFVTIEEESGFTVTRRVENAD